MIRWPFGVQQPYLQTKKINDVKSRVRAALRSMRNGGDETRLTNILNGLKKLDLSGGSALCEDDISNLSDALEENTTLKNLDLSGIGLKDDDVFFISQAIYKNNNIKQINFSNNNIGAKGAQYLADFLSINRSINHINLRNNKIGMKGIETLAARIGSITHRDLPRTLINVYGNCDVSGGSESASTTETIGDLFRKAFASHALARSSQILLKKKPPSILYQYMSNPNEIVDQVICDQPTISRCSKILNSSHTCNIL